MTSRLAAWRCADTLQICTASNADHGAAAANVYPGFRGERRGSEKERRVRQEGEEGVRVRFSVKCTLVRMRRPTPAAAHMRA